MKGKGICRKHNIHSGQPPSLTPSLSWNKTILLLAILVANSMNPGWIMIERLKTGYLCQCFSV